MKMIIKTSIITDTGGSGLYSIKSRDWSMLESLSFSFSLGVDGSEFGSNNKFICFSWRENCRSSRSWDWHCVSSYKPYHR